MKVEFDEARHRYWIEEGEEKKFLPSVTTVLNVLDKPALHFWAIKKTVVYIGEHLPELRVDDLTEEKAFIILDKAKKHAYELAKQEADIGSRIHELIHQHLLGQEVEIINEEDKVQAGFLAYLGWLQEHKFKALEIEMRLAHPTYLYAGTLDVVGILDGELAILDWKSSGGIYLENYLQISAYKKAYEETTGKEVKRVFIIHLGKKDGDFIPYEVRDTETPFEMFLACLKLYNGKKNIQQVIKEEGSNAKN